MEEGLTLFSPDGGKTDCFFMSLQIFIYQGLAGLHVTA